MTCHKPQGLCKGCISLSSAEGLSAAIVVTVALEPASYLADTRTIKKHLFGTYFPKKCWLAYGFFFDVIFIDIFVDLGSFARSIRK